MSPASILVVEDDDDLRQTLTRRLSEAGYEVAMAATGPDALAAVAESVPDLVVLDVMLPGLDGIEVCRRLRADHPLLYILMLTARADELDRVVGLEVGADDYVTKPFSLQEVVARIRSALRRVRTVREQMAAAPSADDEAPIVAGGLTVDGSISLANMAVALGSTGGNGGKADYSHVTNHATNYTTNLKAMDECVAREMAKGVCPGLETNG